MTRSAPRILLTSGATRESVDGVRYLTNFSTGRTGAAIADALTARGHAVTYLGGQGAAFPETTCEKRDFSDFASLDAGLAELLGARPFDAVIHLAAVSDYSIAGVRVDDAAEISPNPTVKLASDAAELTLRLTRNFKIVERLKTYARIRPPRVIAFKLTHTADEAERSRAVAKLLAHADWVVHNDLGQIRSGAPHLFTVYSNAGVVAKAEGAIALASVLAALTEDSSSERKPE